VVFDWSIVMVRALVSFSRLALLIALAVLIQADGAAAESAAGTSRLLFDPSALDGGSTPPGLADKSELPTEQRDEFWITSPVFDLPGLSTGDLVSPNLPKVLAAPKPQSSPGSPLDRGLKVGTFSVGVEVAADSKPRTVVGDEPYADMNSLIDQRRQSGFAPFIGLSAKSTLQ
jgi:hypothetical protein